MSDEIKTYDPGAVWRDQPEEELPVDVKKFLGRRAVELNAATRYEILISVAAALLFVGVMAWRLAPDWDAPLLGGLALVVVWAAATLFWFRRRLRRHNDLAAPASDFYRRELELRRDHLRNAWLWHGDLLLACMVFLLIVSGRLSPGPEQLRRALPLVAVLALWTAFGVWRRLKQARAIQREIDELDAEKRP